MTAETLKPLLNRATADAAAASAIATVCREAHDLAALVPELRRQIADERVLLNRFRLERDALIREVRSLEERKAALTRKTDSLHA